ncbi:MAG: beta-galactosidase [Oscillospiraceae bacterium]|nr:beta-galactosidase [Oscillospiraceae bacterium]MDD4367583.1 beta-galactosidase [Oscillospiraceae bacterium]
MHILDQAFLHGGDYNPDQWLDRPDILEQDLELMRQAQINCVSVGIFAWTALEPEEGVYRMDWLKTVVKRLYDNGVYTILATPSGARPAWLAQRYPEVLRVNAGGQRNHMGERHNHCLSSPVYRAKVYQMNRRLAETFRDDPAVILWHLSNEYSGSCYCEHCRQAFCAWLKETYGSLERLNHEWWTAFWSHTYTSWEQIEPPFTDGEQSTLGLKLAWERFTTDQTVDFCRQEVKALRDGGSKLPVTTNLMGFSPVLNYYKFRDVLDIVSWDNYPDWNMQADDTETAISAAMAHDLMRSIKREPFLLMESTPSSLNWKPVSKLKKPGMHMLASLQAIAHGSDSVQYFQWRKGRGGTEKFHGAVVDHYGKADTRVFKEVSQLGLRLKQLSQLRPPLLHSDVRPEVALLFDWENRWALENSAGPRNIGMHYVETVKDHYRAFWQQGIPVDIIDPETALDRYRLVVAPLLYLTRSDIETKLCDFVAQGGTLVGTYWSGIVNRDDLCYLGGTPHGLMDLFGLRSEEIDALTDTEHNLMSWNGRTYQLTDLCDRVQVHEADVLAVYEQDFYQGEAVLTRHAFGQGQAYYLASRAEPAFYLDFYEQLQTRLKLKQALPGQTLPHGVTAGLRESQQGQVIILQNYNQHEVLLRLSQNLRDLESAKTYTAQLKLQPYEVRFMGLL